MTQGERITKVEANLKAMNEQNTKDHQTLNDGIVRLEEKIDKFIESAEERFAPMYIKNVVVWTGATIGVFLVGFALSKIFI